MKLAYLRKMLGIERNSLRQVLGGDIFEKD